ncbi:MAG: glycosyltransferase family 2 protein [Lachnospiraceae bacterium]|nr:glycosyltransferase family 2 protein [Lachnospiraceae bacterium]
MRFCADAAYIKNEKLFVIGWATGEVNTQVVQFKVTSKAGEETFRLSRGSRPDIGYAFFRDPSVDQFGFLAEIPYEKKRTLTLEAYVEENGRVIGSHKMLLNPTLLKLRNAAKSTKAWLLDREKGAKRLAKKALKIESVRYKNWFLTMRATEEELTAQRATRFPIMPKISILVPVFRTPVPFLREMIESVLSQSYGNFELCIVNADPSKEEVNAVLDAYVRQDARVRVKTLAENAGISGNTNEAYAMAQGEYIALLDHDDTLEPDALFEYVKELNAHPETDVFYSDEDKITEKSNDYFFPYFKSDFNIDLLRGNNYMCHFLAVKKQLIETVGTWDPEYDGAQDYDMILRLVEKAERVAHVKRVLYHWRSYDNSTAQSQNNKDYAKDAGLNALKAHFERLQLSAVIRKSPVVAGWYETSYEVTGEPLISILIPNKDHTEDLKTCLDSLFEKCTYRHFEVLILENNSTEEKTFAYYEEVQKAHENVRVLTWHDRFNFSAINNFGAKEARGEYLLLLNNDVEVISENLLEHMLGFAQRQDVGIVGVKLLYPDDTVQHAGVLVGAGGLASHMFKGIPDNDPGYFARAITTQDVSCVTAACMMVSKELYEEVGGMDERFQVAFNDVDFCLKVRQKGLLIVYDANVKLYHYESKSRGMEDTPEKFERAGSEVALLNERWNIQAAKKEGAFTDPYYNPNLSYLVFFQPDYTLADARKKQKK